MTTAIWKMQESARRTPVRLDGSCSRGDCGYIWHLTWRTGTERGHIIRTLDFAQYCAMVREAMAALRDAREIRRFAA